MSVELALKLVNYGFTVFPVDHNEVENTKKPLTKHGHLDATKDVATVQGWWKKWPKAKVGVPAGENGFVVADIDMKNGKDGWDSLDQNWCDLPDTYAYDTMTGGRHFVYAAPKDVVLNGQSDYRDMPGVDRRGGSSWVMWVGGVPDQPLAPAPEWLCDPAEGKKLKNFAGSFEEWVDGLVPGQPNALVRRGLDSIPDDFSHSEMVEKQHHAIRLGAEGNAGVTELLDAVYTAWMNRPAEAHTTPENEWEHKWFEALESGIEKYGQLTDELKNLPQYTIDLVPKSVPDGLVTSPDTGKPGFSRLLGELIKETEDNDRIASILWNCPATQILSREWGLQFVHQRITKARIQPEPTRENPRIEERRERESDLPGVQEGGGEFSLLSSEERKYLASRPNFVDAVVNTSANFGYDQSPYFRSIGWVSMSMAFGFKGFIPLSATHKLGLNLWFIAPGGSGTGKSVSGGFRDNILRTLFQGEADLVSYDLGDDSSPQGMHMALLERDRRSSLFASDEASGFFASLNTEWKAKTAETLTSWYNSWVQGSNKLSQKELRGKSALTNLCMHMFGTPDKLAKTILAEMFESGFMARVLWAFGNPPRDDSSRFRISIDASDTKVEYDEVPAPLKAHAVDLVAAVSHREKSVALLPGFGVEDRLSEAYERMYRLSEKRENWHLVEPSLTRVSESMLKMAGLCALYRNDTQIEMEDALHAIGAMEEYFENLHRMAGLVSAGQFQQRAEEIDAWIRGKNGKASRAAIFHRFRGFILKSSREIDDLLVYLVESGALVREEKGNSVQYQTNGG